MAFGKIDGFGDLPRLGRRTFVSLDDSVCNFAVAFHGNLNIERIVSIEWNGLQSKSETITDQATYYLIFINYLVISICTSH